MINSYNYKYENFVTTPGVGEQIIKIYNKYGILVHNITPNIAYFYRKNRYVVIEIHGNNDVLLDFENENSAILAMNKFETIKKIIVENSKIYLTREELLDGELDVIYYPISYVDTYFSRTGHTHEYLSISGGTIYGDIIPDGDGVRSLGNATHQWKEIYVSGGTVYLDNIPLSTNGVDLLWSGNTIGGGTGATFTFTNTGATPNTVGGISAGTTFSAKTYSEMWNLLLYPELFPTLTAPSSTFTLTQSGYQIIGSTITTLNFSAGFSRGSISPAYGTSGYRSGSAITYNYTGTNLPSSVSNSATTDVQSVSSYVVLSGNQSWTCSVSYGSGEQPLSNLGNPYSTALISGTTTIVTRTITGVYPYFATTSVISTLTQQTLVANGSQVSPAMVAESGGYKQTIEFPVGWGTISTLQQYNTLSGQWDTIDLNTFSISGITKTISGNNVNYNRYYHNGATIGARSLRFTV